MNQNLRPTCLEQVRKVPLSLKYKISPILIHPLCLIRHISFKLFRMFPGWSSRWFVIALRANPNQLRLYFKHKIKIYAKYFFFFCIPAIWLIKYIYFKDIRRLAGWSSHWFVIALCANPNQLRLYFKLEIIIYVKLKIKMKNTLIVYSRDLGIRHFPSTYLNKKKKIIKIFYRLKLINTFFRFKLIKKFPSTDFFFLPNKHFFFKYKYKHGTRFSLQNKNKTGIFPFFRIKTLAPLSFKRR